MKSINIFVKPLLMSALVLFLSAAPLCAAITVKGPVKPVAANGLAVNLIVSFAGEEGPTATLAAGITSDPDGMIASSLIYKPIVKITRGKGSGKVRFKISRNESSLVRTATLDINGVSFTVNQAGQPCKVKIKPARAIFDYYGGTVSIDVTAPAGCQWNATGNADWISLNTTGGTGNGTVDYVVAKNTGKNRNGKIEIAGIDPIKAIHTAKKIHTVTQKQRKFTGTVKISGENSANPSSLSVAISDNGQIIAVWSEGAYYSRVLRSNIYNPESGWGIAESIGTGDGDEGDDRWSGLFEQQNAFFK